MSDKLELIWYENPTRPSIEKPATSNHKDRPQTKKGSVSISVEIQMSQIQFHHKGPQDTEKRHILHTILGALGFLGALGGKVFLLFQPKRIQYLIRKHLRL